MIAEGDKAPDFCMDALDKSGNENKLSLESLKGKRFLLYFYPKDNTPGCTVEACAFRDNLEGFSQKNVGIFGVSPDSIKSHKKFLESQNLPFTLLSDPDKSVAEKYGAYGEKALYGKLTKRIIRSTFLVDENGRIVKIWRNIKAKGHVEKVMQAI